MFRQVYMAPVGWTRVNSTRPYIVSNNSVYLRSGEQVSFDWRAVGGDAYDVYGYLVNSDTNEFIPILNQTGGDNGSYLTTDWATQTTDITKSGNYKFAFLAGTYDELGGRAMASKSIQII